MVGWSMLLVFVKWIAYNILSTCLRVYMVNLVHLPNGVYVEDWLHVHFWVHVLNLVDVIDFLHIQKWGDMLDNIWT